MPTAPARASDYSALARLGGATLEIVHDLKNQLNGLKLYATFLRKRLEREDQPADERETLAKLISGLDRAAKDLTALVRYARPVELRKQAGVKLQRIISNVIAEAEQRDTGGLPKIAIQSDFEDDSLIGEFDPAALAEAFKAITDDVRGSRSARDLEPPVITLQRNRETDSATLKWLGGHFNQRTGALSTGCGTIHTEVAKKIVEAHGGDLSCDQSTIIVSLPLTRND